jgi:YHS domain-containing protein
VINLIVNASRGALLAAGMALVAAGAAHGQNLAQGDINTGYFGNVAIKGYDPVAYFTVGKATIGNPSITTNWLGAEWHFASTANRDLFIANPISYAPQYGGHCADGMAYVSTAVTINIDPTAWSVIDGKLYLSYDAGSAKDLAEGAGLIGKADTNWDTFKATAAKQ